MLAKRTNWIPSLVNEFLGNEWVSKMSRTASPAVNIVENDTEYRVEIAAPGMTKEDLKISVREDNYLVINISKKDKTVNKDVATDETEPKEESTCSVKGCKKDNPEKYLRKEFSMSYFNQILEIPEDVENEKLDAKFENGVLVITLPKKESAIKHNSREIEVK